MAKKEYANSEVVILWQPEKCVHSAICVKTLPKVYHPKGKPWIMPENASAEELKNQVARCPSGALSIRPRLIKIERENNGRKGRFVIYENDEFAGEMSYVWAGTSTFIIDHTGVEASFRGKGLGKRLVMEAVDYARDNNLQILPLCPFAKKIFDNDTSILDVRLKP